MFDGYYMQRKAGPKPRSRALLPGSREWVRTTAHLDWYDREQLEQAVAAEAARERHAAILGSMFASGRMRSMATHLATHTDMPVEAAIDCLEIADRAAARHIPGIAERGAPDVGAIGVIGRNESSNHKSQWDSLSENVWKDRKERKNVRR